MSEEKSVDYLVLGGSRHREVWTGPLKHGNIELPVKEPLRLPRFYNRDTEAEVDIPSNDTYLVSEVALENGKRYMIVSTEPLSAFDVRKEIEEINPPLKPIN